EPFIDIDTAKLPEILHFRSQDDIRYEFILKSRPLLEDLREKLKTINGKISLKNDGLDVTCVGPTTNYVLLKKRAQWTKEVQEFIEQFLDKLIVRTVPYTLANGLTQDILIRELSDMSTKDNTQLFQISKNSKNHELFLVTFKDNLEKAMNELNQKLTDLVTQSQIPYHSGISTPPQMYSPNTNALPSKLASITIPSTSKRDSYHDDQSLITPSIDNQGILYRTRQVNGNYERIGTRDPKVNFANDSSENIQEQQSTKMSNRFHRPTSSLLHMIPSKINNKNHSLSSSTQNLQYSTEITDSIDHLRHYQMDLLSMKFFDLAQRSYTNLKIEQDRIQRKIILIGPFDEVQTCKGYFEAILKNLLQREYKINREMAIFLSNPDTVELIISNLAKLDHVCSYEIERGSSSQTVTGISSPSKLILYSLTKDQCDQVYKRLRDDICVRQIMLDKDDKRFLSNEHWIKYIKELYTKEFRRRKVLLQNKYLCGDQGLLNKYFSSWSHADISRHLPFTYNVTSNTFYSYVPAINQFHSDIRIVHFAGSLKPWQLTYDPQTNNLSGGHHQPTERNFLLKWWQLMYELVWPGLSSTSNTSSRPLSQQNNQVK
ncbi:unnamed protein product, partial [Didymodactylos carnosus]